MKIRFLFRLSKIKVTNESKTLKRRAVPKLLTLKSSIKLEAIRMINALIKSKKNPKVNKVSGMVKSTRRGFKKVFKKERITATIMAVVNCEISTPESRCEVIKTAKVDTNIFSKYLPTDFLSIGIENLNALLIFRLCNVKLLEKFLLFSFS